MTESAQEEHRLIQAGDWLTAAASVQGRSHAERDIPCQDASVVLATEGGLLIAIVADGAGSARLAEVGSRLAVEASSTFLSHTIGRMGNPSRDEVAAAIEQAFDIALQGLERYADEENVPLADLHTTLICAVAGADYVVAGHIGDGVAVIQCESDEPQTLAQPEHGEFANFTYFLTELATDRAHFHLSIHEGPIDALALTTDGLLDVAFSDPYGACVPWPGFFSPLLSRVRQAEGRDLTESLGAFLGSERIRAATSDDVTLVLAVRAPATCDAAPEDPDSGHAE